MNLTSNSCEQHRVTVTRKKTSRSWRPRDHRCSALARICCPVGCSANSKHRSVRVQASGIGLSSCTQTDTTECYDLRFGSMGLTPQAPGARGNEGGNLKKKKKRTQRH